ncbi:MAG TPA: ABC transporter permease [Candidatus Limnocylindria bacterium]|jgi:peptide/nickel transport system permease protein|nr:ABC transporter permease [Candidatus Limnocylindria bacterium]
MTGATATVQAPADDRAVGLWGDAFRRMRRSPAAIIGGTIVGFFVLVAIFAPFLAPFDPTRGNLAESYLPPGPEHWFGTNIQGQDMLSRIIFGSRLTLGIAVLSVTIGVTIGAFFGALAGYFRGWVDSVIMRAVDIMLSIPGLLFAIAVVTWLGRGVVQIAIAIAVVNIPIFARLLRGSLLGLRESDYVAAARSVGVGGPALLLRHMLPNALGPLIVQATLALATAVVDAAALGFLGLGPPDPRTPEWGTMLSDTYRYLNQAIWLAFFPGIAIVLSVLGFNLLGDGMREALDPRLRR